MRDYDKMEKTNPAYHTPSLQTPFEQELVRKEALAREAARVKFTLGIQGRDGGKCVHVDF